MQKQYGISYCMQKCANKIFSVIFFSAAQSLISHTDTEHIPEVLFDLILHEVSHALGFSSSQFEK